MNSIPVSRLENVKFYSNTTTSSDSTINSLQKDYDVYITDKILAVLMTMNLNSRPWHVVIDKRGKKLYFDTEGAVSGIDLITVNESENPPVDDDDINNINNFQNLTIEATMINEYVKEQILDKKLEGYNKYPFGSPGETVERCIYGYNEWVVGDDLKILVRCQIHAGEIEEDDDENESIQKINVYALNEYIVGYFNLRGIPSSLTSSYPRISRTSFKEIISS